MIKKKIRIIKKLPCNFWPWRISNWIEALLRPTQPHKFKVCKVDKVASTVIIEFSVNKTQSQIVKELIDGQFLQIIERPSSVSPLSPHKFNANNLSSLYWVKNWLILSVKW